MTGPGIRARAIAARWCSDRTMRRIVDPVIADLQVECDEAASRGDGRSARRAWVRGHVALLKALTLHAGAETLGLIGRPSDDRRMLGQLVFVTTLIALAGTVALAAAACMFVAGVRHMPVSPALAVAIGAHAVPLTLPAALSLAVLWARARDGVSRWRSIVWSLAVGASALSFATLGWIAPLVARAASPPTARIDHAPMQTLTLGELRDRLDSEIATANVGERVTAINYAVRWAVPAAPVAIAAFVLAIRGARRRVLFAALGSLVALAYVVVLIESLQLGMTDVLPVAVAAWAPNALCLLAAMITTAILRPGTAASFHAPRWT